jgi:glycosyltransferase involved in cell wall biosynthesis
VPDYRRAREVEEVIDGVQVIRLWSYLTPQKDTLHRILSQMSFAYITPRLISARRLDRPDMVIIESPPLFTAVMGLHVARQWKCPVMFTVADLWPDAAVEVGMLRNPLAIMAARRLERRTYREAAIVRTVTPGFREALLRRGVAPEKVVMIPNGVDTERFSPMSQAAARAELGWGSEFIVLYSGTMGLLQDLTTIMDAATSLQNVRAIKFVFVGDGVMKRQIASLAQERCLVNVDFLAAQPHERVPLVINAADVCLAAQRDLPAFLGVVPVKLYEAMACGKPVLIVAGDSDARRLVEHVAQAGLYSPSGDASTLAANILRLYESPDLQDQLGRSGRACMEQQFDRELLVDQLDQVVHKFLNDGA